MAKTRSTSQVYLLGSTVEVLTGGKLPSLRQVLGFFINEHKMMGNAIREASAIAISTTFQFWSKARIPVRSVQRCQDKLEKEYETWRLLKKNAARVSATQKGREEAFSSKLDDLFDIAHADALVMMTIAEDRDFLEAQREKGRRGCMAGVDITLEMKEKRVSKAREKQVARHRQAESFQKTLTAKATLVSSSSGSSSDDSADEVLGATGGYRTPSRPKRGRVMVFTPNLTVMLDKAKVSDRKAVLIVAETAKTVMTSKT